MSNVFISYRRDDSAGYAHAVHTHLVQCFPTDQLFMDVDSMEPGVDFVSVIEKAVSECDVLVALIGKQWVGGEPGKSRLDNANDYVRLEVSAALVRDIRVIPVLVDGMTMPDKESLPPPIQPITQRNAIELSNTRFKSDVERLITAIRKIFDAIEAKRKADEEAEKSRLKQEAEQRRLAAAEAQRKADKERLREQERQRSEDETRRKAEEENRRLVEQEGNLAEKEAAILKTIPSEEELKSSLESLKTLLEKAQRQQFTFLLLGRTGVGKSSTVNTLMGQQIAKVGEFKATTISVKPYKSEIQGVRYTVFDTPGLCDDLPSKGNDNLYLDKIKSKVSEIDSLWFVTPLDDTRVGSDEKRGIQLITKALGKKIWERAIIVFTFADRVQPGEYQKYVTGRTKVIREEIAIRVGDTIANEIPAVAVSNVSASTPDGQTWLGELFTQIVDRISARGVLPFFISLADRVDNPYQEDKKGDESARRIRLSDSQRAKVKKRTTDAVKSKSKTNPRALAIVGATVGAYLGGPFGALLGGSVGAALNLLSSFGKK